MMSIIAFTTTITHTIKIDDDGDVEIDHEVDVQAGVSGGLLGSETIQSIVRQGCMGAVASIDEGTATVFMQDVDQEKAEGSN